jgi:hypothetical protein
MLRTHHSLKAFCATPVMKLSSSFYQVLQVMEQQWNEIDRGKPTTRRKTYPSATLSTIYPTWTDSRSNPGLRSGRPATNRLSHGTVLLHCHYQTKMPFLAASYGTVVVVYSTFFNNKVSGSFPHAIFMRCL